MSAHCWGRYRIERTRTDMVVIGIVGGIASGKSLVSSGLQQLGAACIDADRLGHQVLEQPDVKRLLRKRWGDQVFTVACDSSASAKGPDANGLEDELLAQGRTVDRAAVARIVFADGAEAERRYLEEVTHPRIASLARAEFAKIEQQNSVHKEGDHHENPRESLPADASRPSVVVLDAALLFEAKWDELCDVVLFVEATESQRLERARKRGWSEDQWRMREASQMPLHEKRRRADLIIDNTGTREATLEQVRRFWERLADPDLAATATGEP